MARAQYLSGAATGAVYCAQFILFFWGAGYAYGCIGEAEEILSRPAVRLWNQTQIPGETPFRRLKKPPNSGAGRLRGRGKKPLFFSKKSCKILLSIYTETHENIA